MDIMKRPVLSNEMSVTQPMQFTMSVNSKWAFSFEIGAFLYPNFSRKYCLKYICRFRLLFQWKRDVDKPKSVLQ
jgi:hypothetical protein